MNFELYFSTPAALGCIVPNAPNNGRLVSSTDDFVKFLCDPSHIFPDTLLGSRTLYCTERNTWDNSLPNCIGMLAIIANRMCWLLETPQFLGLGFVFLRLNFGFFPLRYHCIFMSFYTLFLWFSCSLFFGCNTLLCILLYKLLLLLSICDFSANKKRSVVTCDWTVSEFRLFSMIW